MDILLTLRAPGRLFIGDKLLDDPAIPKGFIEGQMPWSVLSDLLISSRREFVGIVLYANEKDAPAAREFAAASDPRILRYLSPIEATHVPRYKSQASNFCALELRWTST
jgi:hypothetical protein